MTTATLPSPGRMNRARRAFLMVLSVTLQTVALSLKATSRPVSSHLYDHVYTIFGLGLISSAAFVHSVFTGLLVTGLMFLIFEWKVSE